MAVIKLALSAFKAQKTRAALTVLAIAMSVSLVVAVTSGYASAEAAIARYFEAFLGATDVTLSRRDTNGRISDAVLQAVRRDREVAGAVGRLVIQATLASESGQPLPQQGWRSPMASIIGVALPEDADIGNLAMEPHTEGGWFSSARGNVALIDQETSLAQHLHVGQSIVIPTPNRQLKLKIVGVVHKPQIMASLQSSVYVPLETLQEFLGIRDQLSSIRIQLKRGVDDAAFALRWKKALAADLPDLNVTTAAESRRQVEKNLEGVRALSFLGGTVSMLAAAFVVFATLSMGVSERQRTLAMLRTVGCLRRQVAALVVVEGLALAVAGAAIGAPLGCLWIKLLVAWKSEFFVAGAVLNTAGIVYGSVGSVLAALVASLLPAINAMRLDPVGAMAVVGQARRTRFPLNAMIAGLLLVGVDPALIFFPGMPRAVTFYGHFVLGLPCLMLGFFLLAPTFVWVVEKALGRAVATVFGIRQGFLSQQLTQSLWRASGTAAALMVGLAILVVMQSQGRSALSGWRIPDKFPDIFIFAPLGLSTDQAAVLETIEGIKPGEVMAVADNISLLKEGFFAVTGASVLPDATMFLGVDPDQALRMLQLDFRAGSAAEATAKLKLGRHIIVTDEFRQLKGLTVGDKLTLKTPVNGEVDYEIAAVVWSPGIDVFVSLFDMGRQFEERSAASVFGSLEDARRDFGVTRCHLFAANLSPSVDRKVVENRVRQKLGAWGLIFGDVRHIKYAIQQGFQRLLNLLSTVALFAMLVASLGVTNAVMASVRSRRWQLGILRSVGATRTQILRMILAEAVLLGVVGSTLGVAAGLTMSIDANGLLRKITGFTAPIVIPFDTIGLGVLIVMALAIGASLWPAIRAAFESPLSLLQGGRAAA